MPEVMATNRPIGARTYYVRPETSAQIESIKGVRRWQGATVIEIAIGEYIKRNPDLAAAVPTPPEAGSGEKSPGSV